MTDVVDLDQPGAKHVLVLQGRIYWLHHPSGGYRFTDALVASPKRPTSGIIGTRTIRLGGVVSEPSGKSTQRGKLTSFSDVIGVMGPDPVTYISGQPGL